MTLPEVAEATGLTEGTLRHYRAMMRAGGPVRGPRSEGGGGRVRYRRSEVEAWLARREVGDAPSPLGL